MPKTLNPGESIGFSSRFFPEDLKRKNNLLTLRHSSEFSPARTVLYAEGGEIVKGEFTVEIGSASGKPGDVIEVPIMTYKLDGQGPDWGIELTGELGFNCTMLEPLDFTSSYKCLDGAGKIQFVFKTKPGEINAGALRFRAALGDDTTSVLHLKNIRPTGAARLSLTEKNGLFTLDGVCRDGGPRLISTDSRIALGAAEPNPSSIETVIVFDMLQPDIAKLELFSIEGVKVAVLLDEPTIPGEHKVKVRTSEYPAGVYFYVLSAGLDRKTGVLEIVR